MDNQIKECPFCGREAKIKAVINLTVLPFGAHAIVEHEQRDFCPDTNKEDDTMENIEKCKKRAIEAWNRRANNEVNLC